MNDKGEFADVPVSTVQIGATPIQYKTESAIPEEFRSYNSPFEPPKRYILFESNQDILEEVICEDEIFNESCYPTQFDDAQYNIETEEAPPPEAFIPPEITDAGLDIGNFGELEQAAEGYKDFDQHKFQDSKKPMHAPTGKYHIMEIFWFLNPLYMTNIDGIPLEEAHFCTLSLNIDFGNLKVTFYKVPNGALEGHKIYLMSCQRMTSVSIYPSSLFKLIRSDGDYRKSGVSPEGPKPVTVTCMEQLVFKTGENWQYERPMAIFETSANVKLTIKDPKKGDYYYIFQSWQKDALIHAANFVLNQGLVLTGQNIIAGNRNG